MVEPTEFSAPTGITWQPGGHVGSVEYGGGDKGLVVFFYTKATHNPAKSIAAGHPVHEDKIFIKMHPPGERLNIIDRPATQADFNRFPNHWRNFRENREQAPDGMPIDLLYPDQPSVGATLRANGVYTVEQCADLSGHAIDSIGMGAQTWSNYAKDYLEKAGKGVKIAQFRSEMETKDRQIRVLERQVNDLKDMIDRMQNEQQARANMAMQTLVANNLMRPQHMPNVSFDPQAAMIEANGRATRPEQQQRRRPTRLKG